MLKQRIITAIVMLVVLTLLLFSANEVIWMLAVVVMTALAAWEWAGLVPTLPRDRHQYAAITAVLAALCCWPAWGVGLLQVAKAGGGFTALWSIMLIGAVAFWCLISPLWFRVRWVVTARSEGALLGWLLLLPSAFSLGLLRTNDPWLLIAMMAVIWIADIAAYFSGRAFGKHKLAPNISPGKTLEGALGAIIAVTLYGIGLWQFNTTLQTMSLPVLLLGLLLITLLSIAGDLFESLMKRQRGVKDSSQLLPGHGGILDRIDSLTATLPVFGLWYLYQLSA